MHSKSDANNVLCDLVLGEKRNKSLHSHSAKLPTYKNEKLCKKSAERKHSVSFPIDNTQSFQNVWASGLNEISNHFWSEDFAVFIIFLFIYVSVHTHNQQSGESQCLYS